MFRLQSVSAGASPFTWENNTGYNIHLSIGGGSVSALTLNGDAVPVGGVWNGVNLVLSPGDYVTVTYTEAPTMYYKPF